MYLKFEKNKIICRVSKIEAAELLKPQILADKVNFPSGHIFHYQVELTGLEQDVVQYANSRLTFSMSRRSIESLLQTPTKNGIIFLQDKATYGFEIDIRKERRKRVRKT